MLTVLEIRAAILDGDIDKALKHTKAYYANVLEDYPHIHFKLRCRKFLEMMRRSNEVAAATTPATKRQPSVAPEISDEHAVFDTEMELDGDGWDGMDTEEPAITAQFNEALTEAVQYGQQLRMDYPTDENGGDKKMLDHIFSLFAYSDPKSAIHGHYLDPAGRVAVAEELNSAILGESSLNHGLRLHTDMEYIVSLGKSSSAALERVYQQAEALVNEIGEDGGAGAFINVRNDFLLGL